MICFISSVLTVVGTEDTSSNRRVQLRNIERLPCTCSDDNLWYFLNQDKLKEKPICVGRICTGDYKIEKDENRWCYLVINVTKEKFGVYRQHFTTVMLFHTSLMCMRVSRIFFLHG